MTEIEAPRAEEAVAPEAAPSFGRRLAAERERQGLSIDDVAARLRLHPRQVKAIENEALPALPAPFLRGFVRNYAKELRLDPAPLIAELGARLGPQPDERARNESGVAPRLAAADFASRRVVVGGVLAALIALAVLGWLATRTEPRREVLPAQPAAPKAPVPAPAATVSDPAKADTVASASLASAATQASPADAPASAGAVSRAQPAPTPFDGLRLTFREQSWVEVTQSDGRIVHSQINAAGSEQRIEGKAPLRVVIGNAPAVSADFKGKPVDLKPMTGADNVARITLN